ncbi:MAG: cytochrome c oxidase assembly protein subunit 15, partial [Myxococcota bacterium]
AYEAGLACPDWPLCFGEAVPAFNLEIAFEVGHRYLAGFISLVFVVVSVLALRNPHLRRRAGPWIGVGAIVLATQIVFGALTVTELLSPPVVTTHLILGNTFSALLFGLALTLREAGFPRRRAPVGTLPKVAAGVLAVTLFAQLALGGLVSASHAGLACGTWPSCNGNGWFPTVEGLVGLQVMHRITAYTLATVAFGVFFSSRMRGRFGAASGVLVLVVIGQVVLGILNVMNQLPESVTILHSAGAAALVLLTLFLNLEAWRAPASAAISRHHGVAFAAQEAV